MKDSFALPWLYFGKVLTDHGLRDPAATHRSHGPKVQQEVQVWVCCQEPRKIAIKRGLEYEAPCLVSGLSCFSLGCFHFFFCPDILPSNYTQKDQINNLPDLINISLKASERFWYCSQNHQFIRRVNSIHLSLWTSPTQPQQLLSSNHWDSASATNRQILEGLPWVLE